MVANLDESFSCKVCKHSTISDFSGIVYPKASWGKHDIPSCWEEEGREYVGEGREKKRGRRGGKKKKEREEGGGREMMEERSGGEEEEETRRGKKRAKEVREETVTTCIFHCC